MPVLLKKMSLTGALLLLLGLTTSRAFAVDYHWNNPAGGSFNTAANWTPTGVPSTADNAIITLDGTYTVTLAARRVILSLTLGGASGTKTLDLNHSTLTTAAASTIDTNGVLKINGGTLSGAGTQTITSGGVINWTGGTVSGAGKTVIAAGGTLNYSGGGTLTQRTISNSGVFNWLTGIMHTSSAAIINNESGGLFDITAFQVISYLDWNGIGGNPAFNNKTGALLRSTMLANKFQFVDTKFTNNGVIEVKSGGLDLAALSNGGADFTNLTGTTLTGGTYIVTGTLKVDANIVTNAANITLNTSTASLYNNQGANSALIGLNTNTAAGSLTLTGNHSLVLPAAAGDFTNAGKVTLGAMSKLNMQGAGKNFIQTAGSTVLQGGTLATTATGKVDVQGGTLSGDGTVNSTLLNGGAVNPGAGVGVITVSRGYTQSGALNVEIAGANAATPDFDQLNVAGAVTLGGALNVNLLNSYVPTGNTSFTIINNDGADPVVGTFAGLNQGATFISGASAFSISYTGGDGNDVVLKALPILKVMDATLNEGNSGTTAAIFKVSLSAPSALATSVKFATANVDAKAGSDFVGVPLSTLTIPAGQMSGDITISVNGDSLFEGNETFYVNISNPTNAAILDPQAIGLILNDDAPPTLSITDVNINEGNSGTSVATFMINMSAVSGLATAVKCTTANGTASAGSDYAALPLSTFIIPTGQTSVVVQITINGDTTIEADETFKVNLSAPVHATIADAQGIGTIIDDDGTTSLFRSDEPSQ